MFGHLPELAIILVVALIVFGPERLPEVAATAGKFVREVREAVNVAMNPEDTHLSDDFATYYYDSVERSGEEVPSAETEAFEHREDLYVREVEVDEAGAGATPVNGAVHPDDERRHDSPTA